MTTSNRSRSWMTPDTEQPVRPATSQYTLGARASVLPVPLTSFIGREREVEAVCQLVRATRLLTLTGAGGSGKTRLAVEVASRSAGDGAHGAAWVELAPLLEPELLVGHVASTLGVREEGARPTAEALVGALRDRSMLLVLDNCEHLVDACAQLAERLLAACPGLTILATSREALGVGGERAWLVPPLSVPAGGADGSPAAVTESEAVRLFVARAQDVLASFALTERNATAVARICRRLDGLPLAIELAAARVRVLPAEQIAARLDDSFHILSARTRGVPTRHQTLRATTDWSYQLLARQEQVLLQRLSIFAGGFTLESVEAVCAGDGLEAGDILDLLAGLVDKSLVVMRERDGGARYSLLEVVRQYARDRLDADPAGSVGVRRSHAEFFAAVAETGLPHIQRSARSGWTGRLAAEQDNFRIALASSLGPGGTAHTALRLASALWWFWGQASHYTEALAWLDAALGHPGNLGPSAERAHALAGAGALTLVRGDRARARALLEESVVTWERVGESPQRAHPLSTLAYLLADEGEYEAALAAGEEAVRRARSSGMPWLTALAIINGVTHVYYKRGQLDRAESALTEAGAVAERDDFTWGIAEAAFRRAVIALQRGGVEQAAALARKAAAACQGAADTFVSYRALLVRGAVAVREGDAHRAARLFGAAEAMGEKAGALMLPFERAAYEAYIDDARRALGTEVYDRARMAGGAMPLREALELAAALPAPPESLAHGSRAPLSPEAPVAAAEALASSPTPALRVGALGPLEIVRDGAPLPASTWRYGKPRELLLYLLCHPDGRTKEQIGLVFWPDASAAQVKNNFHVTLHHIRKALGRPDWIVFEDERYRVNHTLGVEFDAARFEADGAAAIREARDGADVADRLRAALSLYRGDFLEEETVGDWHLDHRDRLRRLYLDGMMALGEVLVRAERYAEGADVYRRVVLREPLHEEAYRQLMRCHARLGERAAAMRHYGRLATLLRADLEADPEPETAALYEKLRRAEPV